MSDSIKLSSFAATREEARAIYSQGAEIICVDDAKVSARSHAEKYLDTVSNDFAVYHNIAEEFATELQNKSVFLQANIDIFAHDRHLPLVKRAIHEAHKAGFHGIRILDIGISECIREIWPDCHITYAPEMGANTIRACSALAEQFQCILIPNDIPQADIAVIQNALSKSCELQLQVFGPLLLQYTDRRLQSAVEQADADPDIAPAIDERVAIDQQGRAFPVYDNQHGHFMFDSADRCLYKCHKELKNLKLHSWVIDARGEKQNYRDTALTAFDNLRKTIETNVNVIEKQFDELQNVSPRPLRHGFFLANNTDRFDESELTQREQEHRVARVIDAVKGKYFVAICELPFSKSDKIIIRRPQGDESEVDIGRLSNFIGESIEYAEIGELVRLPWIRATTANSLLLLKNN